MMKSNNPKRKVLEPRRLTLLGSAAALAIAVLVAGPSGYYTSDLSAIGVSAHAAEAAQHPAGFADLVAKVKPAVISVRVKIEGSAETASASQDNIRPFPPGSPMEKFFEQFGMPNMPNGRHQQRRMMTGQGSGFFISADGYAVTNYHVVDHAKSVQITTDSGKNYTAKVIGTDQKTDLALIKVDGQDFPYVKFANRAPRIGDWVVAVGNPFGLGGTVTAGIVSASGRDIGAGPYDDYIQIDAPINKGNSGGPAFDMDGNVIGINTAIFSPSGGSVGIGFDVPADTAKMVVAQLKDKGYVTRGWMGVKIQTVSAGIADSLGMQTAGGAIVDEPQAGSPAAKAGIESGDVILAVDGTQIKDSRDLARRISSMAPGSSVKLEIRHNGERKTVALTLGKLPDEQQAQANSVGTQNSDRNIARLGLTLAPAENVAGSGNKGVAVTAVDPDGPAAEQGVQTGDVILDVGGKSVSSPADVRTNMAALRNEGKRTVLMRMKSGNTTKFVALPLGSA